MDSDTLDLTDKQKFKIDYRKIRRNKHNDTHPIYKTRVKHVLEYMITEGKDRYRSVQDVRSATGVSYIFVISLVRLKLLTMGNSKDVEAQDVDINARKYVRLTEAGTEIYNLILGIDSYNLHI